MCIGMPNGSVSGIGGVGSARKEAMHPELRLRLRDLGIGFTSELLRGDSTSSCSGAQRTASTGSAAVSKALRSPERLPRPPSRPVEDESATHSAAPERQLYSLGSLRAEIERMRRARSGMGPDSRSDERAFPQEGDGVERAPTPQPPAAISLEESAEVCASPEPRQLDESQQPGSLGALRAEIGLLCGSSGGEVPSTSAAAVTDSRTPPTSVNFILEEMDEPEPQADPVNPRDRMVDELLLQLEDLDARNASLKRAVDLPCSPTLMLKRQCSAATVPTAAAPTAAATDSHIAEGDAAAVAAAPTEHSKPCYQHPLDGMRLGPAGTASQQLPLGGIRGKRSRHSTVALGAREPPSPASIGAPASPLQARQSGVAGLSLPPLPPLKSSASAPGLVRGSIAAR